MTREELIAALEAATRPSRELDIAVAVAAGRERETHVLHYVDSEGEPASHRCAWRHDGQGGTIDTPHYTASIDAALTLVPEGWNVTHAYWGRGARSGFTLGTGGEDRRWVEGCSNSATPALALCISALRARA